MYYALLLYNVCDKMIHTSTVANENNRVTLYYIYYVIPQRTQMPYHSIYVDWIKLKLKENIIRTFHPATMILCVCVKLRLRLDQRKSNELNDLKSPNQMPDFCIHVSCRMHIDITASWLASKQPLI